jgi:hypothetical protein
MRTQTFDKRPFVAQPPHTISQPQLKCWGDLLVAEVKDGCSQARLPHFPQVRPERKILRGKERTLDYLVTPQGCSMTLSALCAISSNRILR